jgi:SSS family transporter
MVPLGCLGQAMAWISEHWFAAVLFVCYSAVLIGNVGAGRRRSGSVEGFFVGGRSMGGVVVGVSFYATFASTNSYIGHAGKGYEYGLPWMIMAALLVAFAYLSWTLVAPRVRRFAELWNAVTVPDLLAVRFASSAVRVASALLIVFASLLYLIAIFKGAGHLLQVFLEVPYEAAVGLTLVIVVAYTSVGGFVSVVRTDVVQGVLMVIGSLIMFAFVTSAAGGVGRLFTAEHPERLFDWNAGIPFGVLLGVAFAGSLKLLVDPRQVSRFYALKDARSVRTGIWVAVGGIFVIQMSLFPIGMYATLLLDQVSDTDLIVPVLVNDTTVFPRAVGDFLILAIVAAAMSSLDSVLLVAASVLTRDVLAARRMIPAAQQIRWTRAGVVAFAIVAALIALRPPGDIVEITIFSGSLYAACFLPPLLLGLHWRRGNAAGALGCMMVGVVTLVVWRGLGYSAEIHEVFPALTASLVTYVGFAWVGSSVDSDSVRAAFLS